MNNENKDKNNNIYNKKNEIFDKNNSINNNENKYKNNDNFDINNKSSNKNKDLVDINNDKDNENNDIIDNDDNIIIYKINENKDKIKIFGENFVENNKNNIKIEIEGNEYELMDYF